MDALPEPPTYHPFASGVYEVRAGLHRFGKDFGNGPRDQTLFQRDRHCIRYAEVKRANLARDRAKFYATHAFDAATRDTACDFIDARLRLDRPGVDLTIDAPSGDRFADLVALVQEDVCVVRVDDDGRDWLAAAHVCFPNFWGADEKVGLGFAEVHSPVPHVEPIARAADAHVRGMVRAVDGLVRFAWGVTFDDRLDHHPADAPAREPATPRVEDAHVRVERQTIWGLPSVHAALFTIRTYLYRASDLGAEAKTKLASAIESMSAESRAYKGLTTLDEPLIRLLRD